MGNNRQKGEKKGLPSWKLPPLRLKIKGVSLSKVICEERNETKVE